MSFELNDYQVTIAKRESRSEITEGFEQIAVTCWVFAFGFMIAAIIFN